MVRYIRTTTRRVDCRAGDPMRPLCERRALARCTLSSYDHLPSMRLSLRTQGPHRLMSLSYARFIRIFLVFCRFLHGRISSWLILTWRGADSDPSKKPRFSLARSSRNSEYCYSIGPLFWTEESGSNPLASCGGVSATNTLSGCWASRHKSVDIPVERSM